MKTKNLITFKGKLPQIIVLAGDDSIGREKAKERIIERVHEMFGNVNEERFNSTVEPFEIFIEHIITPSLFQTVRIFHIRHAQELSNEGIEKLSIVISSELSDVYIIIEYEKDGRKKKESISEKLDIKAKTKKNPQKYSYLEFTKPPDYKMNEWLMTHVPIFFSRKISKSAAECLIDLTGSDLDKLYSELQKIDIHLNKNDPIDKSTVEKITAASRSMSAFELAEALGRKNFTRVLEIIDSLYTAGFYAPPSVSAIFKHFWKILKIRCYIYNHKGIVDAYSKAQYTKKTEIAYKIGVSAGLLNKSDSPKKAYPVIILSGIVDAAETFSVKHLKQIFIWLKEFDVGIKTGQIKPTKLAFQLLCYKIVRVEELLEKATVR